MNIIPNDIDIEVSQETPLQLSVPKPMLLTPKHTVRDALFAALLEKEDPSECIDWASNHYPLKTIYQEDVGRLNEILDRWKTVKEQRLKWSALPTPIPSLSKSPITVADLCTYLSEIMAIHPLVATIPVYHEECCGPSKTGEIEFDEETGVLVLY